MNLVTSKIEINISDKAYLALNHYKIGMLCLNTNFNIQDLKLNDYITVYAGCDKLVAEIKNISKYTNYGHTLYTHPEQDAQMVGKNIVCNCLTYDEPDCIIILIQLL